MPIDGIPQDIVRDSLPFLKASDDSIVKAMLPNVARAPNSFPACSPKHSRLPSANDGREGVGGDFLELVRFLATSVVLKSDEEMNVVRHDRRNRNSNFGASLDEQSDLFLNDLPSRREGDFYTVDLSEGMSPSCRDRRHEIPTIRAVVKALETVAPMHRAYCSGRAYPARALRLPLAHSQAGAVPLKPLLDRFYAAQKSSATMSRL